MLYKVISSLLFALGLHLATVQAAQVSFLANTGALVPTDFSETLSIGQFDNSLGTLTGVAFGLDGQLGGTVQLENLDLYSFRLISRFLF